MRQLCLKFDWVNQLPTLSSRFSSNTIFINKINLFFDSIANASSIDEILMLFIRSLNEISKASRNIESLPASKLFDYVLMQDQDSRVYGPRSYRVSDGMLIYREDILNPNNLFVLISAIFIKSVSSEHNGKLFPIMLNPLVESYQNFDIISSDIFISYLSRVLTQYNMLNASFGSPNVSSVKRKNNSVRKVKSNKPANNVLSSSNTGVHPSGSRSYSSAANMLFTLEFKKDGIENKVTFPDMESLLKFYHSDVFRHQ